VGPRRQDKVRDKVRGGRFYRVVPRFVVQFSINGDPKVLQLWASLRILDDPAKQKNRKAR